VALDAAEARASINGVETALRSRVSLPLDLRLARRRPEVAVVPRVLRPSGLPKLDALVATPSDPAGVLVYFPGFDTPLGSWERAKCQYLAGVSGLQVVLTEIPGMSRYGDSIPRSVRSDMLRGHIGSWAELNLAYISEALAEVVNTETMQVFGYSTGCSLAVAALPVLAEWGPIEGLNLVEPVAITKRNIAMLQAHNLADWTRLPVSLGTNVGHGWVMDALRAQRREPKTKYGVVDLLAIGMVLSSAELAARLDQVELAHCALARGSRSSLCQRGDFDQLDEALSRRHVPGPTIIVEGLGHQLWHSFPTVAALAEAMLAP